MLLVKMSILTAGAMLWLAPAITPSSLIRNRRGDDCYKEAVHQAFEKAEKTCFDENNNDAEIEERFRELLDFYHSQKQQRTRGVFTPLKTSFEQCYLRKARDGLSMTEEAFTKKYQSYVAGMLEKVNDPYCKAKYAETNVLKEEFINEKKEQWNKLGMFRRAIKTAMGDFVAFANPEIGKCLKSMDGVTLPQLLCAVHGGEATIEEKKKCYDVLKKPEPATTKKTTSTTTADKTPKTLLRLGFFSKYVVENLICPNIDKQHNVKKNLKGAAKIFALWPFATIAAVVAIPIAAVVFFFAWLFGTACEGNWFFSCAGGVGAAIGAVMGLCLLLYSVFGIPWKALTRIFSYDENSNKVDFEEEFKDASWIGEAFGGLLNPSDRTDNH